MKDANEGQSPKRARDPKPAPPADDQAPEAPPSAAAPEVPSANALPSALEGVFDDFTLPEKWLPDAAPLSGAPSNAGAPPLTPAPVMAPVPASDLQVTPGGLLPRPLAEQVSAAAGQPETGQPQGAPGPLAKLPTSQTGISAEGIVVQPSPMPGLSSGPTPAPLIPRLAPMFAHSAPFLARFLPQVPPSHTGIQSGFCNLHDFLRFLHDQNWYGFLHAAHGEQAAYVLVFEGRTVAAASLSSTGEQALGELLHLYDGGAPLSAYPLETRLAHSLSGVGSRAWKFNLTEDFTGLHARPGEAVFYDQGQVVATLPVGLSYEGAFPAPLRPQTLILPRSLAGWAHHAYAATLRGRDAVNAITTAHQAFRAKYGSAGLAFQKALVDGSTPAEYALRSDVALHDLEALLKELVAGGYLKDE